jgi:hypothetical protein
VLCLVDDAHWIDRPSQEALLFAARRLQAEPIALLMAARIRDRRTFEPARLISAPRLLARRDRRRQDSQPGDIPRHKVFTHGP